MESQPASGLGRRDKAAGRYASPDLRDPPAPGTHDWKEGTHGRVPVFPGWERPVSLPIAQLPLLHHDRVSADGVEPERWMTLNLEEREG